jgi:para-aminobenzoate synthetase component 1
LGQPRSHWLSPLDARDIPPPIAFSHDPLADLDRVLHQHRSGRGGWIGFLSYELGGIIEPAARASRESPSLPLIELHRVETSAPFEVPEASDPRGERVLHDLVSISGRERYEAQVARAIELIRAGDIFQANLAHHLRGTLTIPPREAWLRLLRVADPWHGAYLELAGKDAPAIASLSPELFLRIDPVSATPRRITTRPMKGTRPGSADPRTLERSSKDRAELAMIVDLMRNDLGRVCCVGSIAVETPRRIETHATGAAGVHQATATVSGELRPRASLGDVLRAAFPPGSVTGAPKIRAMRVIDELEPIARGPYCGAIACIDDDGAATLSVAIRTALIAPASEPGRWSFEYAVGAGIVADSDPRLEWEETLAKGGILAALGADPRGVALAAPPLP